MAEASGQSGQPVPSRSEAGPWPRFAARLIDGILLAIVGSLVGFALDFNWIWLVLYAVFVYGYFVVCDVNFGRTVGKTVLGLRVGGATTPNPTVEEALRREAWTLLGAVPFIGGLMSLVAAITIGVTIHQDPADQGWHDRFGGGTRVTRA